MHRGYVKLWRKTIDSSILYRAELLQLFIYLLLKANYKVSEFENIIIEPGQVVVSRQSIADNLKLNPNKIYRMLKLLSKWRMIELKSNNRFTIVSICNWDNYQSLDFKNEQRSNNDRTTIEQRSNNDRTHLKKVEERKKEKNKDIVLFDEFCEKYHQVTKIPMTDKASTIIKFKKLKKAEKQKAIDSIENYYTSLPDKKYCKKARTYISAKSFNDEFKKQEDNEEW